MFYLTKVLEAHEVRASFTGPLLEKYRPAAECEKRLAPAVKAAREAITAYRALPSREQEGETLQQLGRTCAHLVQQARVAEVDNLRRGLCACLLESGDKADAGPRGTSCTCAGSGLTEAGLAASNIRRTAAGFEHAQGISVEKIRKEYTGKALESAGHQRDQKEEVQAVLRALGALSKTYEDIYLPEVKSAALSTAINREAQRLRDLVATSNARTSESRVCRECGGNGDKDYLMLELTVSQPTTCRACHGAGLSPEGLAHFNLEWQD